MQKCNIVGTIVNQRCQFVVNKGLRLDVYSKNAFLMRISATKLRQTFLVVVALQLFLEAQDLEVQTGKIIKK